MVFRWRKKKQSKWFYTDVEKNGPPIGRKTAGFVYHRGTGQVIPWHQCIVVDIESCNESTTELWLDWLEYGDRGAARTLAERVGVPMDYLAMADGGWHG